MMKNVIICFFLIIKKIIRQINIGGICIIRILLHLQVIIIMLKISLLNTI